MLIVELFTITSEREATKIKAALEGKSYYNFHVAVCPMGGSSMVNVETDYEGATELEVRDMVMYVLACEVMK
jgi:hypothetical protein